MRIFPSSSPITNRYNRMQKQSHFSGEASPPADTVSIERPKSPTSMIREDLIPKFREPATREYLEQAVLPKVTENNAERVEYEFKFWSKAERWAEPERLKHLVTRYLGKILDSK